MNQTDVDQSAGNYRSMGDVGASAIHFRLDPEAAALRTVLWLGLAFAGVASVALAALWFDWAIAAAAVAGSLAILAMAAAALVAMPRPAPHDGLTLDREGLTQTQAGRQDRWLWSDLGDFTIETRSGIVGRLFGDRVVIRKAAAGSSGHRVRRIIGSCLASPHEIAATVAAFRDHAAGHGKGDLAEADGLHASFHLADQTGRREKTVTLANTATIGNVVVYGIAAAIGGFFHGIAAAIRGHIDGWDAFVGYWIDPISHPIPLTMVIGCAAFDLWSWQQKLPTASNCMVFDATGLFIVSEGRERRWRWDLVSEPEIHDLPDSESSEGRRILFIARHDGMSHDGTLRSGLLPGAVRVAIDDLYDAPLETIAERFSEFRAKAQSEVAVEGPQPEPKPLLT